MYSEQLGKVFASYLVMEGEALHPSAQEHRIYNKLNILSNSCPIFTDHKWMRRRSKNWFFSVKL